MKLNLTIALVVFLFNSINTGIAKSNRVSFNGKKYDVLLELKDLNAEVYVVCGNNQIDYARIERLYPQDETISLKDLNLNITNQNQVYHQDGDVEKLVGQLNTDIDLDNEELVSQENRRLCYEKTYHSFRTSMENKIIFSPLENSKFYFAIKNFRCKYNYNGDGFFSGRRKVQEMFFFITDQNNQIISQHKSLLDPTNEKCVSLQSLAGGAIHVVEGAVITVVAIPALILFFLITGGDLGFPLM